MLQILTVVAAGLVLLLTVGLGVVAHELSHAAVLYLFHVQCDITIGLGRVGTGQFDANVPGTLAAVTPREIAPDTSAWAIRLSSVAPLVLAVPFVTVGAGVVPDPLQANSPVLSAVTIGWLACALPSPQDFSLFWHAERVLADHSTESSEG